MGVSRILLCLLLVLPPVAVRAENAIVAQAISGFVRPAYARFHHMAGETATRVGALCDAPSAATLAAAQESFGEIVHAWARIETVRFGPVTESNRLERILFWPDRKGTGLKQVQAALASKDASVLDPGTLVGKSVAMQGLGALEYILFGTGFEELTGGDGTHRCGFGRAVATNIAAMAGEIDTAWSREDGVARQWANPASDNPLYRTDQEALTELFNVFVHGLEMTRDVRLNGFLGAEAKDDKPRLAVFWRSGATVASIAGNLDGLAALYSASRIESLLPEDSAWISQSIGFEFRTAQAMLAGLDAPVADILVDQRRDALVTTRLISSHLSDLFGVTLAGALGLSAGFSSLDGD